MVYVLQGIRMTLTLEKIRSTSQASVANIQEMVPRAGLEPAQRERRGILNPLCLPIPPPGHTIFIVMETPS